MEKDAPVSDSSLGLELRVQAVMSAAVAVALGDEVVVWERSLGDDGEPCGLAAGRVAAVLEGVG